MTKPGPPKTEPHKTPIEEVIAEVAGKIRQAERMLVGLQGEMDLVIQAGNLTQSSEKIVEVARWMTRRRTLIEVWELATNKVWHSHIVNAG